MVAYTNFYETIAEARMRLDETIVLYDGLPYHVLCIADHKPDGIFRVYLDPVSDEGTPYHRMHSVPYTWHDEYDMTKGKKMDLYLESEVGKASPILRKMMNSPKFNKFRPFDLGMLNAKGRAFYVERSPTRHTQQGLTGAGLTAQAFDLIGSAGVSKTTGAVKVSQTSPGLYSTIVGNYPDFDATLTNMTDVSVSNTSTAFNRHFAIVRGPMNLLFLAYKGEIVGYLPYNNNSEVKIGTEFSYVKEAVDDLACFQKIS